ncbi:MAG TPA: toll/interleukin-1 receptor domain-containing protein, partial [Steroidobacteraceae bacterium]|nr:toll/interleukin-1 receptor domain-containing protein [Steroidobacteraceae bacterium]
RDCAFELVTRLEARGLSVWIAPRDISPAAEWAEEIIDAISSARLMVLVFSSHSNSSPQVRREVERAVHKQLPVLPFRLEDIVPSKSLEYFLSSQHWLDGFPPPREPHYERLCALVAARVNAAASPLAAPSPATPAAMAAVPAGAFSAQQLQSLERQLADHIGPLAQHLVKRAAAQAPDWERLIARLSGEIDSDAARQRFLHACRTLPRPKP